MTSATQDPVWVIDVPKVRAAVRSLIGRKTHPYFIAYLHLRQVAARSETGNLSDIHPVWTEVSEVLRVPDAAPDKPHLRPFWRTADSPDRTYWLNENLAGSFAPSSLRAGNGVLGVIVDVQADKSFTLLPDHVQGALSTLLYGQRMPVEPLAAFLMRDYGFISPDAPTPADVIAQFRDQYGLLDDTEFTTLYDSGHDWTETDPSGPWFRPLATDSESL